MAGEVFSGLITSVNPKLMNAGSRNGIAIDRIIIHHNATTDKNVAMDTWLQGGRSGTSAHYEVTPTEIIGCVGEQYAAWHAGGTGPADPPRISNPNQRSIGIENVNSSGAPNWSVDQRTIQNCARLVADICKRYNIPLDRQHVLGHNEVTATACPGGIDVDEVVNIARIQGGSPTQTPQGGKNGIAIDNISQDQATKMVQRIQTRYAWTLLRDQVKRVFQPNRVYTLVISCDLRPKCDAAVNRLKQELRSYYPGYDQRNIAIPDLDKPTIHIEARNLDDGQSKYMEGHMRDFLKDILLDGQTYGERNNYGTWDVRVKGEGFNDVDAPIVLGEIQQMGAEIGIDQSHIKGFKY